MITDFQQGIVTYPTVGSAQSFLSRSGSYVSLSTTNGRVDVTFAHGSENYYHIEGDDVPTAWGPLDNGVDYWLYWDIDLRTAYRTFGFTAVQPVYAASEPSSPVQDLHWFNTASKKMYVYNMGRFREVVRVFAAKVNNSTFTPLGSGQPKPFAGSQAGLNVGNTPAGTILLDTEGKPVKRANGTFFTSETLFFTNGTPVNSVRLEANVIHTTVTQNIARFQVVALDSDGDARLAGYDDLQDAAIALSLSTSLTGDIAELCVQGLVTSLDWNWPTVGAPLWVDGNGNLTAIDPHVDTPLTYPVGKPPVARVFSPISIYFDQGLGGKGDNGVAVIADNVVATTSVLGTSKLSVPASDASAPVVVGTNDPRMTNARTPTTHTHPASQVTTPTYSILTAPTLDLQLQQLVDNLGTGGSDVAELNDLNDVTLDTPADKQILVYDGGDEQWINKAPLIKTFVWEQMASAGVWNIEHNQNNQHPVVNVFNSDGLSLYSAIDIVDADNIQITLEDGPSAGRAHIIFIDYSQATVGVGEIITDEFFLDTFTGSDANLVTHTSDSGHSWVMQSGFIPALARVVNEGMRTPTFAEDGINSAYEARFWPDFRVTSNDYGLFEGGVKIAFDYIRGDNTEAENSYIEFYVGTTYDTSAMLMRIGFEGETIYTVTIADAGDVQELAIPFDEFGVYAFELYIDGVDIRLVVDTINVFEGTLTAPIVDELIGFSLFSPDDGASFSYAIDNLVITEAGLPG